MDEEIKKLLEENFELTKQTHAIVKKLYHQMIWQKIKFAIKAGVIIVAIILGFKFIPALFKQLIAPYQNLLKMPGQLQGLPNLQGLEDLSKLQGIPSDLLQQFVPQKK